MTRKKKRYSVKLDIGKQMPPLYHTLPGQDFWYSDSEVYDAMTGKWTGVDYKNDEAEND